MKVTPGSLARNLQYLDSSWGDFCMRFGENNNHLMRDAFKKFSLSFCALLHSHTSDKWCHVVASTVGRAF